jgi:hypothetical protein
VVSMPELEAFNLVMVALSACALESCDASPMWLLPPRPSALARASAFAERAASAIGRPRRCARRCSRRFARDDRTARYPRGYSGQHLVDGVSAPRSNSPPTPRERTCGLLDGDFAERAAPGDRAPAPMCTQVFTSICARRSNRAIPTWVFRAAFCRRT